MACRLYSVAALLPYDGMSLPYAAPVCNSAAEQRNGIACVASVKSGFVQEGSRCATVWLVSIM